MSQSSAESTNLATKWGLKGSELPGSAHYDIHLQCLNCIDNNNKNVIFFVGIIYIISTIIINEGNKYKVASSMYYISQYII